MSLVRNYQLVNVDDVFLLCGSGKKKMREMVSAWLIFQPHSEA